MGGLSTVARPGRGEFTFIPSTMPPRCETAINKLLIRKEPEVRTMLAHVVDYAALSEMRSALHAWRSENAKEREKVKLVADVVEEQLTRIRLRHKKLHESGEAATRRGGEARQREIELSVLKGSKDTPRERQRLFAQHALFDQCAVSCDIDTFPAKPAEGDNAEQNLLKIAASRIPKGFSEHALRLDSPAQLFSELMSISLDLAAKTFYPVEPDRPNEAVSFIRELRFFGHGKAGTDQTQPTFWLCGLQNPETIDMEWFIDAEGNFEESFDTVRRYMAPGATIGFEGCEIGKGAHGKAFLALVGARFFGGQKFGFLKANQAETFSLPANPEEGLPSIDPVTYKWPDDLHAIAKSILG